MPSVSGDQQRFMAAAYRRKLSGNPRLSDPKMPIKKLHDFTRKVPGAPERAQGYGKPPVSDQT